MAKLEITVADETERPVLTNLMQFYVHDFSEFWFDRDDGDLENDGRFGDYELDPYWSEPDHTPFLLRTPAGKLVGFVLVNNAGHSGEPTDRNVAEFFIARKYRRGGYGTAAAHGVFSRYPGQWEAAVVRRNAGALQFWRKAIATHPQVTEIREHDSNTAAWNGAIIRFRIREPAG